MEVIFQLEVQSKDHRIAERIKLEARSPVNLVILGKQSVFNSHRRLQEGERWGSGYVWGVGGVVLGKETNRDKMNKHEDPRCTLVQLYILESL